MKEKHGIEYALERLQQYVDDAVRALDVLPDSVEKECLVNLAHYTAIREK